MSFSQPFSEDPWNRFEDEWSRTSSSGNQNTQRSQGRDSGYFSQQRSFDSARQVASSEEQEQTSVPISDVDKLGPRGKYGLGCTWLGESILRPKSFKDLVTQLTLERRQWLFWMVATSTYDITPITEQFLSVQAAID